MARSSLRDPLEKFRFLVDWSSSTGSEATAASRAGFHDVQMPKRSTTKISYREGNDPDINMLSAGLSTMEDIVLSRGLIALGTQDDNEFYKWMSAVHKPVAGHPGVDGSREANAAASEYRKDLTVRMLDRTGSVVRMWVLHNCWPVNFVPGSDLDASEDGEKSLEQLTLAYEDFQELVPDSQTLATVSTSL
jgi:phage tail-like protein